MRKHFVEEIHPSARDSWVDEAAQILFLQAEDIEITPSGVRIILPKPRSFSETIPPLPETRRF